MPNKDKLQLGDHAWISASIKSLRNKLKEYANDPRIKGREDDYIKEQLASKNLDDYWFPGIADEIKNRKVGFQEDFMKNRKYDDWLNQPGNEKVKSRMYQATGRPYVIQESTVKPS